MDKETDAADPSRFYFTAEHAPNTSLIRLRPARSCRLPGGVGSSVGRPHRVVKHQVVPSHGGERVGATVEPADALHKVLVPPIAESADEHVFSVCGHGREEPRVCVSRLTLGGAQRSER